MSFPVLHAALQDDRSIARLLECALRHERLVVPLTSPVKQPGPHYLEATPSEGGAVRVLAEPVGPPQIAGQLLSLSVLDRSQMATLLALVEKLDRPAPKKVPPPGSTLESRIPFIEDAMTTANPRPKPTSAATPAAKAAAPVPQGKAPPAKSAPPASLANPPSSIEVEVEVDDPQAYGDDDDAPTLMQQAPSKPVAAEKPAPAVGGAPQAPEKKAPEYVPVLALSVSNDPASFADTLMPPSSFVERTLVLPVGQGGVQPPMASPAAGRPAPKPEEKIPPAPALPTLQAARPAPIPREEPVVRSDPRAEEAEPPTELHRRPQRRRDSAQKLAANKAPIANGNPAPQPAPAPSPAPSPAASPQVAQGMSVREPVEAPRAAPAPRLIGRTIAGKYTIDSSIGRGATAEVFRAQHTSLKRPVAIKILHQENAGFLQFVKRFKAEAHTLSKLEHQNIARVIDFGQEPDGLLYLVMELLVGKSLESMLGDTAQKLDPRKVIDIGVQTCNALAFAHDEGVIHRDVKPENVILVPHKDEDGKPMDLVKVCDFGLAKLRDPDPENTDITMGGAVCGSPAYMSPEQIVGEKLDPRADLYALSTMLFEALTGNLPYDAIGLTQLFAKKLLEPPATVKSFMPGVEPALEACIMKGLARDRVDRQSDARAYRQELRAALAKLPP